MVHTRKFQTLACLLFWLGIFLPHQAILAQDTPRFNGRLNTTSANTPNSGAQTSQYWRNADKFLPDASYTALKIRLNLIILQRADGSGNFQDNAADRAILTNIIGHTNQTYHEWINRNEDYYPKQDLPFLADTKIEFVPNFIFIKDEYGWNNRNDHNTSGVPYLTGWYLDSLDNRIYGDTSMPKAINLYFTNDGQLYDQMVVLKTTTDYEGHVFFKNHAASEIPYLELASASASNSSKNHTMRCHIGNVWLKLWWFRNVLGYPDSAIELETGKSIAHELGHLMGLGHTPTAHVHALMNTKFGGNRDYMTTKEISQIHRILALYPPMWQFIDCDANYNSERANRLIVHDETWDMSMRLYSNAVVKTGATLTITSELLLPYKGTITVEHGAKLIIDGGIVRRANTCASDQIWQGIVIQGKDDFPHSDPAGIVVLKGSGMIESALTGDEGKGP